MMSDVVLTTPIPPQELDRALWELECSWVFRPWLDLPGTDRTEVIAFVREVFPALDGVADDLLQRHVDLWLERLRTADHAAPSATSGHTRAN
jgi:hypothetical protein